MRIEKLSIDDLTPELVDHFFAMAEDRAKQWNRDA